MILDEIVAHKKTELVALKVAETLDHLKARAAALPKRKPVFAQALKAHSDFAIVAEIKKKSPSKGILCQNFDAPAIAKGYESAGAAAISVLTDEKFFGGSDQILQDVRNAVQLPLLRKDFTLEEYQIVQARLIGADAILLIAAILTPEKLRNLFKAAETWGLDALVEIHSHEDLQKALPLNPSILGINNRDLRDFSVDLRTTEKLIRLIPRNTLVIAESGIQKPGDLLYLKSLGVKAALVGESLMKEKNPGAALSQLLGRS